MKDRGKSAGMPQLKSGGGASSFGRRPACSGRLSQWAPWILGLLVGLNFYLDLADPPGRAVIIPGPAGGERISFSKTFVFWTPDFTQGACGPGGKASTERDFHARLEQKFGGWSRWRVTGSGREGQLEDGWFYQVSLAKHAPPLSLTDIESLLRECFHQQSYYVIEQPHR